MTIEPGDSVAGRVVDQQRMPNGRIKLILREENGSHVSIFIPGRVASREIVTAEELIELRDKTVVLSRDQGAAQIMKFETTYGAPVHQLNWAGTDDWSALPEEAPEVIERHGPFTVLWEST